MIGLLIACASPFACVIGAAKYGEVGAVVGGAGCLLLGVFAMLDGE